MHWQCEADLALLFKKVRGPFVLHIVAGILSHEYDGAEFNLLGCTVTGENRRLWASGRLIKAIIQVQLYKRSHLASAWSFCFDLDRKSVV